MKDVSIKACAGAGRAGLVVIVVVLGIVSRGAADDSGVSAVGDETIHPLQFHTTPPITLEPIGQTSTKAWYRALEAGRAGDHSPWKQLVWFKKDSRTTPRSYFAVVDFDKGAVRELSTMVPSMEPTAARWVDGKLYVGMNQPARLAVFDPVTETLTDLGRCFSGNSLTCFRVEVSPDGMLVLAAAQGSDVSLYDPRTGEFTHFGEVAAEPGGGTYAYSASADHHYVYVAVRSSDPWELVRLDRTTRARRVILTASAQSHMTVVSGGAEVANDGPKRWFYFRNGEAFPWAHWHDDRQVVTAPEEDRPRPALLPGPGFTGEPPKIALDESPSLAGEEAVAVHIQTADRAAWNVAKLPLKLDTAPIAHLRALDDGRLVGVPRAYYAMVLVDPTTGDTERIPLQHSVYGLLPQGPRIFLSGYPNTCTMVFDTTRPMTSTETLPGRPGVPEEDPNANPRLLRFLGQDTGHAHIGMLLTRGADGNIYMIARRHRYFYGFSLVCFRPETGPGGDFVSTVFDDQGAFDHLQISTMQAVDGGRQLLISTHVQANKHLLGEAPRSAVVFLFDVAEQKLVGRYEPLANAQHIAVATMAGPEIMIGSAVDYRPGAASTTFRFNIRTQQLEQVRHRDWSLGDNFHRETDGQIWGSVPYGNYSVIFTIDPKDLRAKGVGRTADDRPIGLCFHRGRLYLSGYPQVMRVRWGQETGP